MAEFAVLRAEWAPADPAVLGPILQEVLGLIRYDAMRMAGNAQGIVAEHLPGAQALALAERCTAAGIAAHAVPQSGLASVGVPVLVRTVRFDPAGLGVVLGYTGPERLFPWPALRLLSVGVIEEAAGIAPAAPRARRRMGLGSRLALGAIAGPMGGMLARAMERNVNRGQPGPAAGRSTAVEMADLFLDDPGGGDMVHLRLRGPDLYYAEILGEQRLGDPHLDFRAVLCKLAEHAADAAVSDSMHALVMAGEDPDADPRDAEFASPHELAQYNVWQLQMLLSDGGGAGAG